MKLKKVFFLLLKFFVIIFLCVIKNYQKSIKFKKRILNKDIKTIFIPICINSKILQNTFTMSSHL